MANSIKNTKRIRSTSAAPISLVSTVNSSFGYNVTQYGIATGNTGAVNSAALNTLLNTTAATGSTIYFPPGTYSFSTVTTVSNKYFHFVGHGATLSMTGNSQILSISSTVALTGAGARWTFTGLTFTGTGSGASQAALFFSSNAGLFRISDCLFTSFGNAAISLAATNTASTSQAGSLGGVIIGCRFYNNATRAISCGSVGEYIQIIGCQFLANATSIYTIGGNLIISNNVISYNTTGIQIQSGTNSGKCIISDNHITHNSSFAVNIENIAASTGISLNNNNMIFGTVRIANCAGVTIAGGLMNCDAYTFDTNTGFTISDVKFAGTLANTLTLTGQSPSYKDCYHLDGRKASDVDNFYAEKTTITANTTFTVPAGYSIESIIFENTTANAVTGGIKIGTTAGGTEVITAQAVAGNTIVQVNDADILKKIFSSSSNQTLYIQAVTAWNSASVNTYIKLKQLI